MEKFIFTTIIFLSFFTLLAGGFLLSTPVIESVNSTQSNTTITGFGVGQTISPPTCSGGVVDQIPLLGQGACMAAYLGFMFSIAATRSDIIYLAPIIGGLGAVLVYAAVRLVRGGG